MRKITTTSLVLAKNIAIAAVIAGVLPEAAAFAQASNPFGRATQGAESIRNSLAQFGLVVGGIGMVACLMLGFFGKLNWKWVGTGVGVSFGMAVIPTAIGWLSTLATGSAPAG